MSRENSNIRNEMIDALNHSPMIQFIRNKSSDTRELRKMLEESKVITYPKGQVIIREGGRSDRMFFLTSGTVEVSIDGKAVCTLERTGDVFGEMGVIAHEMRSATVTAQTDVTCLATGVTFVAQLAERGNMLFLRVLQDAMTRILMGRLRITNEDLAQTKHDLEDTRQQLEVAKLENLTYEQEVNALRVRGRDRFHGPQSGADDK